MDLFCTCRKCKKFSQNGDGRYLKTKKTFIKHQKKERSLLNNNDSSSEESSEETEETSEYDSINSSDNEQNIVDQRKKRKTREFQDTTSLNINKQNEDILKENYVESDEFFFTEMMSEQNASEIFEETKNNPRYDVAEISEEIESDSEIEGDSECDDDLDIPIDGIYILII
ncbi:hypothetical protein RhiirC2_718671 [Rhizophagus irregularis]|uniref:Uncharacterized protein n=1 Tax=Rhizophagus irregularis TaxID=588596 RepID=A0A2N1MHH5_9GLOM|nr:hypothetical protein RhiirC2_718671 [Rhizophagus irregularis]